MIKMGFVPPPSPFAEKEIFMRWVRERRAMRMLQIAGLFLGLIGLAVAVIMAIMLARELGS